MAYSYLGKKRSNCNSLWIDVPVLNGFAKISLLGSFTFLSSFKLVSTDSSVAYLIPVY